jgi:purine nucleosidase
MKILFDTDPGIDDAMALLMLARDARAELVGITTVFGNASIDTTTRNALALCERFGIHVPVARGAGQALALPLRDFPFDIHGHDGLGNVGLAAARQRAHEALAAPRFISEMARRHGGELTLVAVGPLTNLALALEWDPELPRFIQNVVVMGGAFGTLGHGGNVTPFAEANIYSDPHAADVVLGADWPVTVVGLDVTHQVLMSTRYLDALGNDGGEEGRFIRQMTHCYEAFYNARTGGGIYSHDASAVACALDPAAFDLRPGPVRVVTAGEAIGQTLQVHDAGERAAAARRDQAACVGVDAARLLAEYRALFVR